MDIGLQVSERVFTEIRRRSETVTEVIKTFKPVNLQRKTC